MSKLRMHLEPHERKYMIDLVAEREVATAQKDSAVQIWKARHAACEFYAMCILDAHKLDPARWMLSDDISGFVERPKQKVTQINGQSGAKEGSTQSPAEETSQESATG